MNTKNYSIENYNLKIFDFKKLIFNEILKIRNFKDKDLSNLNLEKFLEKKLLIASKDLKFLNMYKKFIRYFIKHKIKKKFVYQKYPTIRLVKINNSKNILPPHSDCWYGHSPDEINYWLPLQNVSGTESLHIISKKESTTLWMYIQKILGLDTFSQWILVSIYS